MGRKNAMVKLYGSEENAMNDWDTDHQSIHQSLHRTAPGPGFLLLISITWDLTVSDPCSIIERTLGKNIGIRLIMNNLKCMEVVLFCIFLQFEIFAYIDIYVYGGAKV